MECVAGSPEEALYPWAFFIAVCVVSLTMARYITDREARKTGEKVGSHTSTPKLQALNMSLALYTVVLAAITLLLLTLLAFCAVDIVHLGMEALFRTSAFWDKLYYVQKALYLGDKLLRPGMVLGYIAARHWSVHFVALSLALAAGFVHTILFARQPSSSSSSGSEEDAAAKKKDAIGRNFVQTLHGHTLDTVISTCIALYFIVLLRELALVALKKRKLGEM